MDRNREARRGTMAATNGFSKRRHRSSSLRDSPEEDGGAVEFHETARLRDRSSKKDRDRSSRSKRRRGDRLIQGSNREEGGEESTDESADDDEEDEDEVGGTVRMLPPNPVSSSLQSNHHQRKSFPPTKVVRTAPWKVSDEMGFSVPKKARSASVKRSQECWISGGGGVDGEKILRQASTSPARPSVVAPTSPSSSNASVRKKMKHIGPKHRLPKISNKPSSNQEDIEIEVAEVLYGLMRQSYCPSRPEVIANLSQKLDSKDTNGSSNDAKSRVSSPISVSPPSALQSSILPQNSSSSTTHLPAVAPKRKRPRPVKFEDESPAIFTVRNCSISSVSNKVDGEQSAKIEISSPKLDRISRSSVDISGAVVSLEPQQPESAKPESTTELDSNPLSEASEVRDGARTKEELPSIRKEYPPCSKSDVDPEDATVTKAISTVSEGENQREEKYKIDLMALPPSKSSPERNGVIDFVSDSKPLAPDVEMKAEIVPKEEDMLEKNVKQDAGEARLAENMDAMVPESESQKSIAGPHRNLDQQIDLEKQNKDSVGGTNIQRNQKLQQQQSRNEPKLEKAVQSTSLPLSMTVAGWPGGLSPLGYNMGQVRPLQGIVPLEGNAGTSPILQPSQLKRCATHFRIARNIHCHQQFTRMNPFWPSAPGSAFLYGTKAYNLNVVPPTETTVIGNQSQGSNSGRNFNSSQDKAHVAATFSGNVGKDIKSSVATPNLVDGVQRKQVVLQQAPQPAAAGNLMPTPTFIFPMNHQQAAAATGNRSGAVKSASAIASVVSSIAANSASGGSSSTAAVAAAPTVSFNYPNLPPNEAQYLAILQNNGYPFTFPAPVAAPPPYRGEAPHPQAISFFNGTFYPSQMPHPSPLQQQQQQQQQPPQSLSQPQQGHPNTSTSSGSSSSQKHQQNHQQLQSGGSDGGVGNSRRFSVSKNRQQQQQQQPSQKQQNQNQSITTLPPQVYQLGADMSVDDSSLTGDCRISQAHHKSVYNQNFSMPMHPKNSALMSSPGSGSGNHGEKQQQQRQSQQHSLKGGIDFIPSQAFFNGAAPSPGLDFSSMAQNRPIFQSMNGNQIAAVAAQQKKTQVSDSVNAEDERKAMAGKGVPGGVGQSLVFSRPDSIDNPLVSTISGTENSARPGSGNRTSRSNASVVGTTGIPSSTVNTPNSQHQQLQQLQQQQLIHLQKQQQQHMQQQQHHQLQQQLAAQTKPSNNARANAYSDRLPSSSSMVKFSNAHTVFPQGYIQPGGSAAQSSPQWKSSTTTSLKNLPEQQIRNEQGHMQISFGGVNPKPGTTAPQGQNQSASPPVIVGSPPPPTTSIPKSSGGSPRTTSTGSKAGAPAPSTLSSSSSSQQVKNSSSGPSRKSSPILGNSSHVMTTPSSSTKAQSQQHQQLQKHALQQAQLLFSNAYMQAQSPHSTTTTTSASPSNMGYYHQRRQTEPQQNQQKQGPSYTSTGMLLCPSLTLVGATTSDPAKAVAAAANNMKGGAGLLQAAQFSTQSGSNPPHPFMSATFPYVHSVPTAQVKPAEQKQPSGNDNLHATSHPEKR